MARRPENGHSGSNESSARGNGDPRSTAPGEDSRDEEGTDGPRELPCPAVGSHTHSAVVADQLFAFVTGVGKVGIVAGDAVRAIVHLDVLAAIQGLLAVVAVKTLCHGASLRASFTC